MPYLQDPKLRLYWRSSKRHPSGDCLHYTQEKWTAVLCPCWAPDLRDTTHVPPNGLSPPRPLPAPSKTGCNMSSITAHLPTSLLPSHLLHRMYQLHQPSSHHSASHPCPHLGSKARVPAELARTDSSRRAERVRGWVWRVWPSSRFFCCVWVQVSLTYSANETQPGEVIDLRVRAARGSCVCVAAVDKSIYLLRSGFRLTPTQVSGGPWALGSSIFTDVSSFPITEKPRINPDCLSSLGSFSANPILVAVWVQLKDLGVKSNVTLSGSHLFSPLLPILKMG